MVLGHAFFILLGISVFANGVQYVNKLLDAAKHTPNDVDEVCSRYTFEYRRR